METPLSLDQRMQLSKCGIGRVERNFSHSKDTLIGWNQLVIPDGTTIVSGSQDGMVKVWDGKSGKELLTLQGHSDRVRSVAVTPDGKTIVSGSYDKTIKVWDAKS